MFAEGSERLGEALKSGKLAHAIPAQTLLETGNKLLKECHKELDLLNNSKKRLLGVEQHQPSRVAKQKPNENND